MRRLLLKRNSDLRPFSLKTNLNQNFKSKKMKKLLIALLLGVSSAGYAQSATLTLVNHDLNCTAAFTLRGESSSIMSSAVCGTDIQTELIYVSPSSTATYTDPSNIELGGVGGLGYCCTSPPAPHSYINWASLPTGYSSVIGVPTLAFTYPTDWRWTEVACEWTCPCGPGGMTAGHVSFGVVGMALPVHFPARVGVEVVALFIV